MAGTTTPVSQHMLNKVPEVTLIFWIIKIMSTTVGETGADYLAVNVGLGANVFLVSPVEVITRLGVDPATVKTVLMTHLHYDHTGHTEYFPDATFLMQAEEMAYVTGPLMAKPWFRHAYVTDEIVKFVRYLHAGRVHLHGRDQTVADGISVHWVGGHCAGQEVVRVRTKRGWVMLASDALHYYEEIEKGIPFVVAHNISDMLMAHDRIRELADTDDHIVPAHDPRVLELYPSAGPGFEGIAVCVSAHPRDVGASRSS